MLLSFVLLEVQNPEAKVHGFRGFPTNKSTIVQNGTKKCQKRWALQAHTWALVDPSRPTFCFMSCPASDWVANFSMFGISRFAILYYQVGVASSQGFLASLPTAQSAALLSFGKRLNIDDINPFAGLVSCTCLFGKLVLQYLLAN